MMFLLQCFLSIALWKILILCCDWIYIFISQSEPHIPEIIDYALLAGSFALTLYFFRSIRTGQKSGEFYWWILLAITFRLIIIPFQYIATVTAYQGVILLWVIFIPGILLAMMITNKLFSIIKNSRK